MKVNNTQDIIILAPRSNSETQSTRPSLPLSLLDLTINHHVKDRFSKIDIMQNQLMNLKIKFLRKNILNIKDR